MNFGDFEIRIDFRLYLNYLVFSFEQIEKCAEALMHSTGQYIRRNVRYALACRDATNQAREGSVVLLITRGLGWLRHDKLKHIGLVARVSPRCGVSSCSAAFRAGPNVFQFHRTQLLQLPLL